MKNIYEDFFYVPKHGYGKVKEKVLYSRIAVMIGTIIICLAAMSFVAFAFFTHDIASQTNTIKTAIFDAKISILDNEKKPVNVIQSGKFEKTANLKKDIVYTVTLEKDGNAKTGFCVLSGEDFSDIYHTQQLGEDINADGGKRNELKFTIKATEDVSIVFFSHWGTSSKYADYENADDKNYIKAWDNVEITVTPIASNSLEEDEKTELKTPVPSVDIPDSEETTSEPQETILPDDGEEITNATENEIESEATSSQSSSSEQLSSEETTSVELKTE